MIDLLIDLLIDLDRLSDWMIDWLIRWLNELIDPDRLIEWIFNRLFFNWLLLICSISDRSSSSSFMSDPDLRCHDAPFLSVLCCSNHFHSFYSHPVAKTLCKCQSLFSSVSLAFNLSCHDCIFNFLISHNMSEEFHLLTSYDIYQLSILWHSIQYHFILNMRSIWYTQDSSVEPHFSRFQFLLHCVCNRPTLTAI